MIKVIGHRGVPRLEPENTMASFRKAVALGADGLELDLRLSRDGGFVVMHDQTLGRTTSGFGWVHLRNSAHLRSLDAGAWFRGHPSDDRPPFLREILEDLPSGLLLNLEIKAGVRAMSRWGHRLEEMLDEYGAKERVLVSSFSMRVLRIVRELDRSLPIAVLGEGIEPALELGAAALHPQAKATGAELVADAHGAGLSLHPWDANSMEELSRLVDLGVDGIITDEVAVLREVIDGRRTR